MRRAGAGSSTFDGRCSVTSTYSPALEAEAVASAAAVARGASRRRSESIIVLPT